MITSNYVRERRQALEWGEPNYALSDDRPCEALSSRNPLFEDSRRCVFLRRPRTKCCTSL